MTGQDMLTVLLRSRRPAIARMVEWDAELAVAAHAWASRHVAGGSPADRAYADWLLVSISSRGALPIEHARADRTHPQPAVRAATLLHPSVTGADLEHARADPSARVRARAVTLLAGPGYSSLRDANACPGRWLHMLSLPNSMPLPDRLAVLRDSSGSGGWRGPEPDHYVDCVREALFLALAEGPLTGPAADATIGSVLDVLDRGFSDLVYRRGSGAAGQYGMGGPMLRELDALERTASPRMDAPARARWDTALSGYRAYAERFVE